MALNTQAIKVGIASAFTGSKLHIMHDHERQTSSHAFCGALVMHRWAFVSFDVLKQDDTCCAKCRANFNKRLRAVSPIDALTVETIS